MTIFIFLLHKIKKVYLCAPKSRRNTPNKLNFMKKPLIIIIFSLLTPSPLYSQSTLTPSHLCLDCHTTMAKKEFIRRWEHLDSISETKSGTPIDSLWRRYCHSLEQITQIHSESGDFPDNYTIDAWWAWYMLYSDFLCWDTQNKVLYLNSTKSLYNTGKKHFINPPRSPFDAPERKPYVPLY